MTSESTTCSTVEVGEAWRTKWDQDFDRFDIADVRKAALVAEQKAAEWRRCAEYALHLAQNGECAPGGNETWAELERMMRRAAGMMK